MIQRNRWTGILAGLVLAGIFTAGAHHVLHAFGTPPVFQATGNQRSSEGDAIGLVVRATADPTATLTYDATAVNQVTGTNGLPAGLVATNTTDVNGAPVLLIGGTLTSSTAGLDDGSVGLYQVTVTATATVRDGSGNIVSSDSTQQQFTWDVSRWTLGDVFVAAGTNYIYDADGNITNPDAKPAYSVYDRNGTFKRNVTINDVPTAEGYTIGCAVNWHTGEISTLNFDDFVPGVNVIERHPDANGEYTHLSRRIDLTRLDNRGISPLPIDSSPESIAFSNDQSFFVGFSFGWFSQDPNYTTPAEYLSLDPQGNPTTDPTGYFIVDSAGNPLLQQDGSQVPSWTWIDPDGYYMNTTVFGTEQVLLGQDGLPLPEHEIYGRDLHYYPYNASQGNWDVANRQFYNTRTGFTGTDQIDLSSDGKLYYTSETSYVYVFDTTTGTQLPVLSGGPIANVSELLGIRILPPGDGTGGFLVASDNQIFRLDGQGKVVQQYQVTDDPDPEYACDPSDSYCQAGLVTGWYSVNVDPDGHTFWAANPLDMYHFDISTGATIPVGPNGARKIRLLTDPVLGTPRNVSGICVMNEYTAAHEICGNGIDDDGNGLIDENCKALEICSVDHPGDDNGDGLVDANDPQCGAPAGTCAASGATDLSVGGFCARASAENDNVTLNLWPPCTSLASCSQWGVNYQLVALDPNVPGEQLAPGEIAGLPPGLTLDSLMGTVTGRPLYSIVPNSPTAAPVVYVVKVQGTWANPSDGVHANVTKAFRWSISNTDQIPVAVNDGPFNVAAGQTITLPNVLANDSDPDGDTISLTGAFTQPSVGTVSLNGTQFQFTAPAAASGQTAFTYTIQDSYTPAATATATVTMSITGAPIAQNDAYAAGANVTTSFPALNNSGNPVGLLANDSNPQGGAVTVLVSSLTQPVHGAVSVNANGSFTYTPTAGFSGVDTFTYRATNGTVSSTPATVTITVLTPPVATPDSYSTTVGVPVSVGQVGSLLANDVDPLGGTLSNCGSAADIAVSHCRVVANTSPAHGTLNSFNAGGGFTYTPNAGYSGTDSFTYVITNGVSNSNPGTVTITIANLNLPPLASPDTYTAVQGTVLTVAKATGVLANDTDVDTPHSQLTAVVLASTAHGTLALSPDGSFVYTPAAGFWGVDTFTYYVNDGQLNSLLPGLVTIVVDAPPVANPDSYTTTENASIDTGVQTSVRANDSDPDTPLTSTTVILVAAAQHGTILLNAGGGFHYAPNTNYFGTDTFTYKLNDGLVDSNVATVTITITPVNQAPVAAPASATTAEDTPVSITLSGSDIDSASQLFTVLTQPQHGTLSALSAASCAAVSAPPNTGSNCTATATYTPAPGFSGADGFTYKVNDGSLDSGAVTVTLTVTAVNQAPVAAPETATTNENAAVAITLSGTDVDSLSQTFAVLTPPAHGTLSALAAPVCTPVNFGSTCTATVTYTPAVGFTGPDTFTYRVNDGHLNSAAATVSLTVTPLNQAPVAANKAATTNENAAVAITLSGTDIDSLSQTFAVLTPPAHGTLGALGTPACTPVNFGSSCTATVTYTPAANYRGADSFNYKVNDGSLDSAAATVTLTVTAVNQAPVATNVTATTNENAAVAITLSGTDIDSLSQTFAVLTQPAHGTLSVLGAASCTAVSTPPNTGSSCTTAVTYTPASGYAGADTFTYKVNDGALDSPAATVTLTVVSVNQPPAAANKSATTVMNTAVAIALTGTDVDSPSLTASIVAAPAHGTLSAISAPVCTVSGNGSSCTANVTYTPASGYVGADSFTYQQTDPSGAVSNIATVSITVASANHPPVAVADTATTAAGTAVVINLISNDSDPDGDTIAVTGTTAPAHGTVVVAANIATYTPAAGFTGTDTFTYTISDGNGGTATATVTVTVQTQCVTISASNKTYHTDKGVTFSIGAPGVLDNDFDLQHRTLTVGTVNGSASSVGVTVATSHGTVKVLSNGSFTYTPAGNYIGTDTFTYRAKASDGTLSNMATVTITVEASHCGGDDRYQSNDNRRYYGNGQDSNGWGRGGNGRDRDDCDNDSHDDQGEVCNSAPTAADDAASTPKNTTLTVGAPGVLANDSDPDGDSLTVLMMTSPAHGTLTLNANGSFTYVPAHGYLGADSFTYKAKDPSGALSNLATVTITVVDRAPTADNDTYTANENATLTVSAANGVLNGDSDPDGDAIAAVLVATTTHGTLSLASNGSFTYTPASGFYGTDTFTYKASDGTLTSSVATVTIAVGKSVTACDHSYSGSRNRSSSGNVLDNCDHDSSRTVSAVLDANCGHGTLTWNGDGTFTYTPKSYYTGTDTFTFHAVDSAGACSHTQTVTVTIR